MPRTVQLKKLPVGFSASATLPGQTELLEVFGFHTSDEGLVFARRLECCGQYLAGPPDIRPSQVDHLLIIIAPNREATVYANELEFIAKTQVMRGVQAGDPVMLDDIADITEIDVGVEIPVDCGIIFLFSWRWRKGLFFDLRPLGPNPSPRDYNLSSIFAACHSALVFSDMFALTDDQWETMMGESWFPFAGLKKNTLSNLICYCQQGWDIQNLESSIVAECKILAPQFGDFCEASDLFKPHAQVIKTAARHFAAGDYLSAAHLLYPRIEGVLRAYHLNRVGTSKPKVKTLLAAAREGGMVGRHSYCRLLLDKFEMYLHAVIFAGFDPVNPVGVSRHTIGHGVVDAKECDEKSVAIGFLALHHLYYSLGLLEETSIGTADKASISGG